MNPDNIDIVLVHTTHSGNIGGVARAMKNMGLTQTDIGGASGISSARGDLARSVCSRCYGKCAGG